VRENVITQRFYESVNAIYLSALLQEADRIVVQLENHRRKMVKKYKIDESIVNVVPNNILSPIESPVTSNRPRCLLFVGSLIRRKGVDILLKAFEHLVSDELDIQLHIAGEGPLQEKIRSYVSRQNIDSKVTLHGYVHDVRALMKQCDILVVPSRMDPFPNVVLEALSVGTPSVVTDIEELRSAFGEAVEYAPANDPYGLASTVRKMIDKDEHENLKKKTITKRKNFVFDWVKEFELILRNMTRKNVESQA
jgi:glycosyltransferase involved in cell wall biosynthesis